jgi:hypothetical protein
MPSAAASGNIFRPFPMRRIDIGTAGASARNGMRQLPLSWRNFCKRIPLPDVPGDVSGDVCGLLSTLSIEKTANPASS